VRDLDGHTIGVRIAEARGRRGLTQADLASEISLDRSALAKIEIGARRVTAIELAQIADALGERIEWFLTEPTPAIVSHRNFREPGAVESVIDAQIERVARHVEFVAEHDQAFTLRSPAPRECPDGVRAAENMAAHTRAELNLAPDAPLLDISRRASDLGLLTFAFRLGPDAADAASILLTTGGVALVNGDLKVGRRRLAVAHEIGHFLCADEYTVDWRVAEQPDPEAREARLDRFARALLLPEAGLRRPWNSMEDGEFREAAVRLASTYRVDMSTLARRLVELGLASNGRADAVRKMRTTRADIVEFDLIVTDELAPAPVHLPHSYETSVLRLYRDETISGPRAIDLLFDSWAEDDLPELPELPRESIWSFV
jgi:Zn-dependent peptidase ImmA (M78 family)/transcriptional regulator with XRE-family HTH domain